MFVFWFNDTLNFAFEINWPLKKAQVLELKGFTTDEQNTESESNDEEQEPGRLKRSKVIDFQVQLKSKSSEELSSADETSDSGAKYLGFFSSRSLKTREKCIIFAQFVLLSLYIFSRKCVYFSIFEW